MKKNLHLITLFLSIGLFAQVGVGTTTPAGALDITSTTSGLIPPRVALTSLIIEAPVLNPQGGALVEGTLIWNTATAGVIPNNVIPGMYYWHSGRWISLAGSPGGLDWSLSGNTGTNPATNYVGTTDNVPLILRANSIERIRMGTAETVVNEAAQNYDFRVEGTGETEMFFVDASTNHVHIRASSPFPTIDMFTSVGPANDYPINGYASGQSNAAVYGQHTTAATGTNMNVAGAFDGSGGGFTTQPGWNVGVVGTGIQAGIMGTSTNPPSNNTTRQGGYFSVTNTASTVQATASIAGKGPNLFGGNLYYGGFFDGGQSTNDFAYVGVRIGTTDYGIASAGTKATMIKDSNDDYRIMHCTEAPEILFQDFGEAKLVNGKAVIRIEELLSESIANNKPVKVFIQLEGNCNGVYVTNKSNKGFEVIELNNGTSNVNFSWQIVGNRADVKDRNGNITSKFADVRFPIGPNKIEFEKPEYSKKSK
jgi:hypothetical protein